MKCQDLEKHNVKQDAQLSQRDHAAGYISFDRKWKTGTGRQYFTDIIGLGLSSTTASKAIKFGEKRKKGLLHCSRSFKDIGIGTKRKPVGLCDFILVINSN